jgi:fatty acid desaturase
MSEPATTGDEMLEPLDGAQDVPLAPVKGPDPRRSLPAELFPKRPLAFAAKFWFAMALIAACWVAIAASSGVALTVAAIVVLGLMYAHLVELQHECLHEHAFNSRRLNRVYGFLSGLFMLSSYSYYKYEHLRHHASLGKPNNREFFNYRFRYLNSVPGFFRAAFHLGRYTEVLRDLGRAALDRPLPNVPRDHDRKRIYAEYRLFLAAIVGAVAFTAVTGSALFLLVWVIPVLLVSEPTHFLIELPEHFGLNTQTNPDVLANTRTIEASLLAHWFTNGNNLHTAHHYHQGVPMVNVARLDELVRDRYTAVEPSYWSFYRRVITGEITYADPDSETCMTR